MAITTSNKKLLGGEERLVDGDGLKGCKNPADSSYSFSDVKINGKERGKTVRVFFLSCCSSGGGWFSVVELPRRPSLLTPASCVGPTARQDAELKEFGPDYWKP